MLDHHQVNVLLWIRTSEIYSQTWINSLSLSYFEQNSSANKVPDYRCGEFTWQEFKHQSFVYLVVYFSYNQKSDQVQPQQHVWHRLNFERSLTSAVTNRILNVGACGDEENANIPLREHNLKVALNLSNWIVNQEERALQTGCKTFSKVRISSQINYLMVA